MKMMLFSSLFINWQEHHLSLDAAGNMSLDIATTVAQKTKTKIIKNGLFFSFNKPEFIF